MSSQVSKSVPLADAGPLPWIWAIASFWLTLSERASLRLTTAHLPELSALEQLAVSGAHVLAVGVIVGLHLLWASRQTSSARAIVLALPLCGLGLVVGHELTAGAWISQQAYAPVLRWGAGLGAAFVGVLVSRFAERGSPPVSTKPGLVFALGLFGAAAALLVADRLIKPSLFPRFHLSLYLLATTSSFAAAAFLVRGAVILRRLPRRYIGVPALVLVLCSGSWVFMTPSMRAGILLGSPVGANLLREVWPNASVELLGGDVLGRKVSARGGSVQAPEDASVILITVDAMRADTVPPGRAPNSKYDGLTPFLDRWLSSAYRFEFAYAQSTKTLTSLPPMFTSQEAFAPSAFTGLPLAEAAREMGMRPTAVVPTNFIEPRKHDRNRRLIEGYDLLEIYAHEQMNDIDGMVARVLEAAGDERVFMWLHLYHLHEPGFDGRLLKDNEGTWPSRYPRSLRALDREMKEIVEGLRRDPRADKFIIVMASDHGENLGQHGGRTHGMDLYEPAARVPLAIWLPGSEGPIIPQTVGNIDVLPTLRDLLGLEADPTHDGHSLVPLMADPTLKWEQPYYLHLTSAKLAALVFGRDKLIYDWGAGAFHRFDLRTDPDETHDLYDPEGSLDADLRRTLAWMNPKLAVEELKSEAQMDAMRERLTELDEAVPLRELRSLVRQIAVTRDAGLIAATLERARTIDDPLRKALITNELSRVAQKPVTEFLTKELAGRGRDPAEIELVRALARFRQPAFDSKLVISGLKVATRRKDLAALEAWVALITPWKKTARRYFPILTRALLLAQTTQSEPLVDGLLANLAKLTGWGRVKQDTSELREAVLALRDSPRASVRSNAFVLLGHIGNPDDAETARNRMKDKNEDSRVRQAALHAYAQLAGSNAIEDIQKLGRKDPRLTVDAIEALRVIGDPAAIPFVRRTAKKHHHWLTRRRAKAALKELKAKRESFADVAKEG